MTDSLNSITISETGKITWQPVKTGSYALDCSVGRICAKELCASIAASGNAAILPRVISAMPHSSEFTGTEIGFLTAIAEFAAFGFHLSGGSQSRKIAANSVINARAVELTPC